MLHDLTCLGIMLQNNKKMKPAEAFEDKIGCPPCDNWRQGNG